MGDANATFVRNLQAAAQQGRFAGKTVFVWACGDPKISAEAMRVIDHGGLRTWWPMQRLDPRAVPALMRSLNRVIEATPRTGPSTLMKAVIQDAVQRATKARDTQLLERLKNLRDGDLRSEVHPTQAQTAAA